MNLHTNGIELSYEVRGEGEPLLLLHGFTGAGADWVQVFDLDELARRYRLVIPDLRGHGGSSNDRWPLTHERCADDVFALLEHLGVERWKAVGASLGANTLLHMATQQPARPEALVLVAATPYFPAQARQLQRQVGVDGHSEEEWRLMRARHRRGDDQIRALWRQTAAFADDYRDLSFTPPRLGAIRARTLIVNGDHDPLYPARLSLELYEAIPGAALWIVPGGGHGPIYGHWRAAFAETALAFLAGALPA